VTAQPNEKASLDWVWYMDWHWYWYWDDSGYGNGPVNGQVLRHGSWYSRLVPPFNRISNTICQQENGNRALSMRGNWHMVLVSGPAV